MPTFDREKFLANDPAAAKACSEFVSKFLRRFIWDSEIVDDATQSAMVRLIAKLLETGTLTSDEMARELSNSASNALRRRLTQLRRKVITFQSQFHSQPHTEEQYAQLVDDRKEIARIERVFETFSEHDQQVLLAKVQGFTNTEIAESYGTTKDAVRGSAARTRQKLRMELTAEEKRRALIELVKRHQQERQSPFRSAEDSSSDEE